MNTAWSETRVSLRFALTYGCFAPVANRIPYDDHALRDVAYGECMEKVTHEMNLRPIQPDQIAIYNRKLITGIVRDVEQVGLMVVGQMRCGSVVHTVMRCLDDEQWETTISRNKVLKHEEVVDG